MKSKKKINLDIFLIIKLEFVWSMIQWEQTFMGQKTQGSQNQ